MYYGREMRMWDKAIYIGTFLFGIGTNRSIIYFLIILLTNIYINIYI